MKLGVDQKESKQVIMERKINGKNIGRRKRENFYSIKKDRNNRHKRRRIYQKESQIKKQ